MISVIMILTRDKKNQEEPTSQKGGGVPNKVGLLGKGI